MMKSRGLRPANCARIALQTSLRAPKQFSTHAAFRAPVLLRARTPSLGLRSTLITPGLRAPLVVGSAVSAIRFASTSPVVDNAKVAAADATTSNAPLEAASSSVDGVTNDFLANIVNMPEQIGYLKAIGLDYGWGPTACIEWLLEHVHIWGGIPWWASIVVTAVMVRTALFPLFARTSDVTARQHALKPVTAPLNAKMNAARIAGNSDEMMMARAELMQVYKHAGINPLKAFYAPVTQAVTGYCTWKLLSAMAKLPVPGLETGGFLWLSNLTVADPYFIMPVLFGGLIHYISKTGGETGSMNELTGLQKKALLYFLPGMAVLFTVAQPATVQVSFFTASLLGMLQGRLLRNRSIREWLDLSPIVDTAVTQTDVIDVQARASTPAPGKFNWEAPTVKSSVADAGPINKDTPTMNPWTRAKKSYMETRGELKDFKDGILKRAGLYRENTSNRKQSKEFLKRAEEYEQRRQAELKQEKRRRR